MKVTDLKFKTTIPLQREAKAILKNGYEIIVRTGYQTATNSGAPFEFDSNPRHADISDDVVGYLTEKEVNSIIGELSLKPAIK